MAEALVISVLIALLFGVLVALVAYGILYIVNRFATNVVDDLTARRVAGILGALVFVLVLLDRLQ